MGINPLKTQLNPICHLLALLGAHPILHVSRIRVKCIGLEWLGHVTSMEQTRVTKKIFESKSESRRYVGRPRLRGLEDVDSDL